MSKKKERHFTIKQIIQGEKIVNQAGLLSRLRQRGFRTTQATLSRDLHEMGIVRVPSSDGYRYVISEQDGSHSFIKVVGMEILGVYHNENTIVVKTISGRAQGVALFIDQMKHRNILATLAGENAIVVIPDQVENIPKIKSDLESIAYQ
jgi:transcriptional regulator of arginine metabolism